MAKAPRPAGAGRPPSGDVAIRGAALLGLVTAVLFAAAISDAAVDRLLAGDHGTGVALRNVAVAGYLPAAMTAVEREREQLRAERDAFDRFVAAVESITVRADAAGGVSPVIVGSGGANRTELSEVRSAYRNTVMGIDHFDSEYGEGLYENMAMELTENVASAVMNGQQFSRPLKQAVIRQSRAARSRRDALLEEVADERDSIEETRERLRAIESDATGDPVPSDPSLTELFEVERRLRRRSERYERLLRRRQRHVHAGGELRSELDYPFLQRYLYDSLEVDFPGLATVIERYERHRNRLRAVRREIAYY